MLLFECVLLHLMSPVSLLDPHLSCCMYVSPSIFLYLKDNHDNLRQEYLQLSIWVGFKMGLFRDIASLKSSWGTNMGPQVPGENTLRACMGG